MLRRLQPIAILSWFTLALVTWRMPQGAYSDPAWGLKALQQYLDGVSPSINHMVQAQARDLSTLAPGWISWWPPGPQLAVYPLARSGVSLGMSVRLVSLTLILFGALGWARWIAKFGLPRPFAVALCAALPWHHYASSALATFSAELFVFAVAPWLYLLGLQLAADWENGRRVAPLRYVLLGLALGAVYVLKYTCIFVSIGVVFFLTLELWRARAAKRLSTEVVAGFVTMSLVCGLFVIAFNLNNARLVGAMNPITSTLKLGVTWTDFGFLFSYPVMILADADSLWAYVMLHPTHGLSQRLFGTGFLIDAGSLWTVFLGLPGGLVLLAWLARDRNQDAATRLVKASVAAGLAIIFCLYVVSGANLYQARYFAGFSIAMLPWAVRRALEIAARSRALRVAIVCGGLFYVGIPLAYGFVSSMGKSFRVPHYRYSETHLYEPLLSATDVPAILSKLQQGTSSGDVWYLTDPETALEFRGPLLVRHADFMEKRDLVETLTTSRRLDVHLVLPVAFEDNGKSEIIRADFPQAKAWHKTEIDGALNRWDAELIP